MILDGVKVPPITQFSRNIAHEMWIALHNLFQNKNENRVLALEDKLKSTKMIQCERVTLYLIRLSLVKDELVVVGVNFSDSDTVRIALKGFTKEWKPFIKGIIAREKFLDSNRLWYDFIKEELRVKDIHPKKKALDDDAELVARMKGKQKKDLSKVKCFNYGNMGHFSSICPMKKKMGVDKNKKGKQVASVSTSAEIDSLNRRLEKQVAMISHFSEGTINEDGWYMESGVLKHMTRS